LCFKFGKSSAEPEHLKSDQTTVDLHANLNFGVKKTAWIVLGGFVWTANPSDVHVAWHI
jgi:hypothetical protein